jgi:hypothetical protein
MKYLKLFIFTGMVFLLVFGCTVKEQVRVDIDKFIKDQASYIDEDVVITATLEDVVSRYALYRGKKIELSAPFNYFGSDKFWTWYIMLKKGENTLRCYTNHYRLRTSNEAVNLLMRAERKKESITVLGVLNYDGIDIEIFSYDGISVRPDQFFRKNSSSPAK